MFNKIRAAWLWASILKNYRKENYAEAAALAEKYKSISFQNSVFRALDATLDILNEKSEVAREKFSALSIYLESISGEDALYIKLYSDYYICLIDKCEDCDVVRRMALESDASVHIKKWLTLPNIEVPI